MGIPEGSREKPPKSVTPKLHRAEGEGRVAMSPPVGLPSQGTPEDPASLRSLELRKPPAPTAADAGILSRPPAPRETEHRTAS